MNEATTDKRAQERELMRRVAASDESAISELYSRFVPLVYRMVRRSLANRCDVEDVVQDTFVLLWRTAARFDPERASLVTWVMLITRRRIVDTLRQFQRAAERAGNAVDYAMAAARPEPEHDERFAHIVDRMDSLSELQRTVLTRAYLRGQTLRQIGEDLRTPLGTVKTALSRGVNTLRAEFSRPEGDVACAPGRAA